MFSRILPVFTICMFLLISACDQGNSTGASSDSSPFNAEDFSVEEWSDTRSVATRFNGKNEVLEQGLIIDGKKEGTWISFQPANMFLDTVASYLNGQLNGPMLTFNRNGRLESRAFYKDGKKHGTYTKFDYRAILEEGEYRNGLRHGIFKSYYKNKNIREESHYKNGKRNGKAKYYDDEGNLLMEYVYRDNEIVKGGKVDEE